MSTLDRIIKAASALDRHIVLPEGEDGRIAGAAATIAAQGIARLTLIGNRDKIGVDIDGSLIDSHRINIIEPGSDQDRTRLAPILFEARRHKGITCDDAFDMLSDPLLLGATMVRSGEADGMVAGAAHPTASVVRSALQLVGMVPESKIVSSFFLMQHDLPHQAIQGTVIYADCGMVIDPNPEELACIAIDSAHSAMALIGLEPKIALLSFSTAGSAQHPLVDKVRQAGAIITKRHPELPLMTEVQFDAAIMGDILKSKAPDITVEAPANVFIFPDLQSGNIAYKIAQRIGGVKAIGPVLQGLNQPVNDLSRGCSVDDIVNLVAVTAVQSHTGS